MDARDSARQTWNAFAQAFPLILGILLLMSLITVAVPKEWYATVFTGSFLTDPLVGALLGSIAAGNPITSYIIGGELLNAGVTLVAVTAFITSWVTVGIVTLPVEMELLGRRFALSRTLFSFLAAIPVSIATVVTLEMMGVTI
jgi:uncharacterized membrane protein YraQ (UPF0718 family)